MDWVSTREAIAKVAKRSVEDYVCMSGMSPWDVPESWIQNEIARKLSDTFYVMLEVRTANLLEWEAFREKKVRAAPAIRSGRVDLALFEKTPNPSDVRPLLLIEIKKYSGRGICFEDVARLRELGKHLRLESILIVAFFVYPNDNACRRAISELKIDCGVSDAQANEISFIENK